jgi:alpha-L-fucosidase
MDARLKAALLMVFAWGSALSQSSSAPVSENPVSEKPPATPLRKEVADWQHDRFGMFIHWGPVSLTGKEISWSRANSNTNCPNHGPIAVETYDNLYKRFNPTNFEASDWVSLAKDSGMRYLVFTAKHCDGFLLWDSKAAPYNVMASPYGKDICAELAKAAGKSGMPLGWYFSPMDWRDPECRSKDNGRFVVKMQAEIKELLSNYGTISVLWFDSDGRKAMWHPETTYSLVRGLQPQILIDNRLEMDTPEQWRNQGVSKLSANEDFYTPEQKIGTYDDQQPWESCITLGTQWSWKPEDKIKTADEVLTILAKTAGGDGNLLLDVGPMPDGRIEPRQVAVLRKIGDWLKINGESIYGTRGGPYLPTERYTATRREDKIFIHVLKAESGMVTLPPLPSKITGASLVGGGKVRFTQTADFLKIALPDRVPFCHSVICLQINGNSMLIPKIPPVPPKQIKP